MTDGIAVAAAVSAVKVSPFCKNKRLSSKPLPATGSNVTERLFLVFILRNRLMFTQEEAHNLEYHLDHNHHIVLVPDNHPRISDKPSAT